MIGCSAGSRGRGRPRYTLARATLSPALHSGQWALARELHFDKLAVFVGGLEELAGLENHGGGQKHRGELPDASVVGVYVVIEEFAAVGDAFFQLRNAILQLQEI